MKTHNFAVNSQFLVDQGQKRYEKSPQKIGKIYSKVLHTNFQQSYQSVNFHNQTRQEPLKQQYRQGRKSPLLPSKSLYLQKGDNMLSNSQYKSFLQMNTSNNKSFRINKINSSQSSNKKLPRRKKTPELVGKLSTSKISLDFSQNPQQQGLIKKRSRSPGYLTSRASFKSHPKQSTQNIVQISKFNLPESDDNINSKNIFSDVNDENKKLLIQVKEKELYLKNLIEKNRRNTKMSVTNFPVPKKNVQDFNHNYPVSKVRNKNLTCKPQSVYIKKIQQNSKGFKSFLSAPKNVQKRKDVKDNVVFKIQKQPKKVTFTPKLAQTKKRIQGLQQVLQKSRSYHMRISPSVNISFAVKTPRSKPNQNKQYANLLDTSLNQSFNQEKTLPLLLPNESKQTLRSQISSYSPEINKNFNNRKPKYVDLYIDPFTEEYFSPTEDDQANKQIQLAQYGEHFSRSRIGRQQQGMIYSSGIGFFSSRLSESKSLSSQDCIVINLKTKISLIKQSLIQSGETINMRFSFPSAIFSNHLIHKNSQIKDLHWLIQKIYQQMSVKPQIITIKQYKNGIFTGVYKSRVQNITAYSSIIYHFEHGIYIGEWKEVNQHTIVNNVNNVSNANNVNNSNKNNSQMNSLADQEAVGSPEIANRDSNTVHGFKEGIGLEIYYRILHDQITSEEVKPVQIQLYYGQFVNNFKQGYGIKLTAKFQQRACLQQRVEIGCWKDNLRHGWVKTYKNSILQENGEYQHNILVKKRVLHDKALVN